MKEVHIEIEDRRRQPSPVAVAAVEDLLSLAQQGALVSNLGFANQVRNNDLAGQAQLVCQQGIGQLRLSILARAAGRTQSLSATEARSSCSALSANELAATLADLRATVAAWRRPT
ncbi:MAG: hypothetical protein EKK52_01305 [Burkholderiales bacterium]|nr:MAG: hypothetical protein EKK52_01305 [Burkholderiales bacterium]